MAGRLLTLGSKLKIKSPFGSAGAHQVAVSSSGTRELLGFGINGQPVYQDRPDIPMPAIRWQEETSDVLALRAKEKGDWRKLSIEEKKALYRASFCQTFSEFNAPTGEWKSVIGCSLAVTAFGIWLYIFMKSFGADRTINLENAVNHIIKAKSGGAQVVALSECFNSPYGTKFFKEYAEDVPNGISCQTLSKAAKDNDLYIIGGTIPEKDNDKLYNTCTVWNPQGEMIAKYRKMHLFDILIPGVEFKESDSLSAGNELVTFHINNVKFGIGICYDLRFEQLANLYRQQQCHVLVYPGAFNMTTGPLHWELLQRGRATDNQVFVCAISPARSDRGYIAWGHSQVSSPWGKVLAKGSSGQEIVYCDIDISECDNVRQQIPIFAQRRLDIYNTSLTK
ncbi:hypothetical protein FQR65_LT10003 [Abscondita terminalis]|nr:hypothetical protein FQR65_LT10003 [Abscondita terminalis]